MRFVYDSSGEHEGSVRLEACSPRRFQWFPEVLVRLFAPSRAQVIRADAKYSIRYHRSVSAMRERNDLAFYQLGVVEEGAAQGARPDQDAMRRAVLDEFTVPVRDAMELVRTQYGRLPLQTARESASRIMTPIRQRLDARLEACTKAGMDAALADSLKKSLGIEEALGRWESISSALPNDMAQRITQLAQTPVHESPRATFDLPLDLDQVPAPLPKLPQFNEVVLGDMHGNCELLLHSLVKLGLLRIADNNAWIAMVDLLGKAATEPPSPADYQRYKGLLARAVAVDPGAKLKKLVLLGDLLADRRHNDLYLLEILDRLDAGGLPYDITLSNHDAQFIHYLHSNTTKREAQPFAVRGIGIGPDQTRSLERMNDLLNLDKSLWRPLQHIASRAYYRHLKAVSCSMDGSTLYSHAVVNRSIFVDLCKQAGVPETEPAYEAVRQINDWFRNLTRKPDDYAKAMEEFGTQSIPTALFACSWNVGPEDDRYAHNPSHPYATDPRSAHPDFQRVVHGHTCRPGDRMRRDLDRLHAVNDMLERQSRSLIADQCADVGEINQFVQGGVGGRMPYKAVSFLMTATMHARIAEGDQDLTDAWQSCVGASRELAASMNEGLIERIHASRTILLHTYEKAWGVYCGKAGIEPAARLSQQWVDSLQASIVAATTERLRSDMESAVREQTTENNAKLNAMAGRAKQSLEQHVSRGNPGGSAAPAAPANAGDAQDRLAAAFDSTFHSLDAEGGMGSERRFQRTVFLA